MRLAFTLIELLVVITIIVVLLALLVPSLDKAVYQTQLLKCGTQLRAAGGGVLNYSMDYRRHYPVRPALQTPPILQGAWRTMNLSRLDVADERPVLKGYVDLKLLVDPLGGGRSREYPYPVTGVCQLFIVVRVEVSQCRKGHGPGGGRL